MAGAGLPISGWYTDAELAYWGSLTHTQTHLWAFLTAGQTRQKFLGKYFKKRKVTDQVFKNHDNKSEKIGHNKFFTQVERNEYKPKTMEK